MAINIPKSDADFNERQDILATAANENAAQWGLDTDWLATPFGTAKERLDTAWAACQNPLTRTTVLTAEKSNARKVYEPLVRTLIGIFEHNTKMTDEERIALGIAVRGGGRTPIPAPTSYPDVTVEGGAPCCLVVNFRDHNATSRAKPHGVQGAVIRYGILDSPPTSVEQLVNTALDTASPYTVQFGIEQQGKKAYFCLCWQNAKGEQGPWSRIESAFVP